MTIGIKPTLQQVFIGAHLRVALLAVCIAGIALVGMGLLALRAYTDHNLRLIARSMIYTVEAAVVFGDATATGEALALIAAPEQVSEARVLDREGNVLAEWQRPPEGSFHILEHEVSEWLLPTPIVLPIVHDGEKIGTLQVTAHGADLLHFLGQGIAGIVGCLMISAVAAIYFSQRLVERLVGPMRNLASVAHSVRRDRAFERRVEAAPIAELDSLGGDFNALLDELQLWQAWLEKENSSLAHQANHDSLTGLANRSAFEEALAIALHASSVSEARMAVLFIDCDRFKDINDRHGHATGDAVLIAIASRLRAVVRSGDLVARLGGDEFAILATGLNSPQDAVTIASHVVGAMRQAVVLPDNRAIEAHVSVGIALYPDHAQHADDLMERADSAMYRAKSQLGSASDIAS